MDYVEMVVDSVRLALINYRTRVVLKEKDGERCLAIWVDDAGADAIRAVLM
jgi:bifunctional DNase/RNase